MGMLAFNVHYGETVTLRHEDHGEIGDFRIERRPAGAGAGTGVRVLFNMPRAIEIRILKHREHQTTFGLSGQARGPLKLAQA
ncbi:MAG: hypothetical protein GC182_08915 [Rhodopseudomonas sp.]|nr:hypothetical protein [Rhodopseudomonas sp.]